MEWLLERVCAVCGVTFYAERKQGRPPVVCGDPRCRRARNADVQRRARVVYRIRHAAVLKERRRVKPEPRTCEVCGVEFTERYKRRTCGSACAKRASLLGRYRMTGADFRSMLAAQDGLCAACLLPFTDEEPPQIDHCHATGRVRGLLHRRCNVSIGHARDDPRTVERWAAYLTLHRGE